MIQKWDCLACDTTLVLEVETDDLTHRPTACPKCGATRIDRQFSQATIDATVWLIVYQPADLDEWLRRHPPADALRKIAQERIDARRSTTAGATP